MSKHTFHYIPRLSTGRVVGGQYRQIEAHGKRVLPMYSTTTLRQWNIIGRSQVPRGRTSYDRSMFTKRREATATAVYGYTVVDVTISVYIRTRVAYYEPYIDDDHLAVTWSTALGSSSFSP